MSVPQQTEKRSLTDRWSKERQGRGARTASARKPLQEEAGNRLEDEIDPHGDQQAECQEGVAQGRHKSGQDIAPAVQDRAKEVGQAMAKTPYQRDRDGATAA